MADRMDRLLRPPTTIRDRVSTLVGSVRSNIAFGDRRVRWSALAALVGIVAAGLIGWWSLSSDRPAVELSLPRAASGSPTAGTATATDSAGSGSVPNPANGPSDSPDTTTTVSATPTSVVIHVAGAVLHPGVVTIAAGGRVADAVAAAGGLGSDADVDRINLASALVDGSRVYVLRRGEAAVPPAAEPTSGAAPGAAPGAATGSGTGGGGPSAGGADAAPVSLNRATAAELDALPGIGPSTAASIVEYRTAHGPFGSVDELLDVRGIGPAKLEQLRPRLTLS